MKCKLRVVEKSKQKYTNQFDKIESSRNAGIIASDLFGGAGG